MSRHRSRRRGPSAIVVLSAAWVTLGGATIRVSKGQDANAVKLVAL